MSQSPNRKDLIEDIFGEVSAYPVERWSELLDLYCGNDAEIRRQVESLLNAGQIDSIRVVENFRKIFVAEPSDEAPDEPLDGQTIGNFSIIRQIGRGGMGNVYLGEDLQLGRQVAIKFLAKRLFHNPNQVELFLREARIASQLRDPRIVTIHQVDRVGDHNLIVMELVSGVNLRQRLQTKSLEMSEALRIAISVVEALQAAHQIGIIHCDIKPENVMIDVSGAVKVLDFGLARFDLAINQEEERTFRGTPEYTSPEQRLGWKVDARSDIYSFGVMLHEMVAGIRPDDIESKPVRKTRGLAPIITRCLAVSPDDRYQSASDLLVALNQQLKSVEEREALRRLVSKALLPTAVILVLVAGYYYYRQYHTSADSPPASGPR
jgi:serine/threonine protein kinase